MKGLRRRGSTLLLYLAGLVAAMPLLAQATPGTSTSQNPTATFATPGVYAVTLRACNAAGCRDITRNVTVLDPMPKITSLTVPGRSGADPAVHFTAQTTGKPSLAHRWIITKSTGGLPIELTGSTVDWDARLAGIGNYQVQLEVQNASGTALSNPVAVQIVPHTFLDVPIDHWAWSFVEAMFARSVTAGCAPGLFCPDNPVTRGQMAIYLLLAKEGPAFIPPLCTVQQFNDVPCTDPFAPWINELVARGITAGCGNGNYCPGNSVTREQMAVFLLTAKEGSGFTPPACTTSQFFDVPCSDPFAPWINELVARGITAGCGAGNFCSRNVVTRAQMSVFLTRMFDLPLP
jgi:hypothetical protein